MATRLPQPAKARRKREPNTYYPLALAFSYQALRHGQMIQHGLGQTTEISSTCIRVKPLSALSLATTEVAMSIAWPAKLKDGTSLQFFILAKPCWDGLGLAEFAIMKHEFRTASQRTLGSGLGMGFGAGNPSVPR